MTFENANLLYLLLLIFLFIPVLVVRWRKSYKSAAFITFASSQTGRKLFIKKIRQRMLFSNLLFALFVAFIIIALSGPLWGERTVSEFRRGVDVVLAFDLSRSMDVTDSPPFPESVNFAANISRLQRGAGIARELVPLMGDVRVGTTIGRGRGIVAVPLTHDPEIVMSFLYGLDGAFITGRGTNLESILDAAASSFQDAMPTRRVVILFSDGEELTGSFLQAAERARQKGITLNTVALGTYEGGNVPVPVGWSAPDGFLLADDGSRVVSTRQSAALQSGAQRTGGIYVSGDRPDVVSLLAQHINSLYAETHLVRHRQEVNPRWHIFVLAALVSLAGMKLLSLTLKPNSTQTEGEEHYAMHT